MRKKPYLIDGIIGNGRMLLGLTKNGEIQRLAWPRIDGLDQVNRQWAGFVTEDESDIHFFHEDAYQHEQAYIEDTNILQTNHNNEIYNIEQLDYVLPNQDVWVRDFMIKNISSVEKKPTFVYFSDSSLQSQRRFQTTMFDVRNDRLSHYYRDTAMVIAASAQITSYQAGKAFEQLMQNNLEGREILNDSEGVFTIDLGSIPPGESRKVSFFISLASSEEEAAILVDNAKQTGEKTLREATTNYWHMILDKREKRNIPDKVVNDLYKRSILTFHLLQNKETGAFIAGPEVDEDYDYSGGYAYCWGRDAAFIASAVDAAGYHDSVSKFYRFVLTTQNPEGYWDQRHYTDGVLAPTWGIQIDETGSIVWGMNQHYQQTKDEAFRKEIWPSVKKAADFLVSFVDLETGLPMPSKDLWEKREGEHLYSTAAVYGGLMGAASIAKVEGELDVAEAYRKQAEKMKEAVITKGWNDEKDHFNRSLKLSLTKGQYEEAKEAGKKVSITENEKGVKNYILYEDLTPDISLLGLSYPFEMIEETDEQMIKTANVIELTCTSKIVGGVERFPGDVYIGGNPWLISTLWLSIYKFRTGKKDKAIELFSWTTEHANHLGLMPEQIDKETNQPAWVMPLTWSHAMYVLTIKELV
ncbi:glycoside hydrolase family 15 protein [Oceanobacillus bengalensis]|uniref:Glycoside hydrolase family 15 n=1 Tax=Oceanobacillus bengalensis TaxID=1435466 RepID=A0A494Z768_9BACI|nr:glycoside hydrolase family 15 protein [Oceanobacillus bengalensis]RKQ18166.1 glycoside hydrolase family 15 [Oceanobacillus bengalensis]